MSPEPAHEHGTQSRTGILLVNLGTPDAPTAQALRPYLKQFLSNPRVIEMPQWAWWPILNGIILNTRPKKSAEKYAQVWMPEGSPLKVHTERQTQLLRNALVDHTHPAPMVEYAMSIGSPSIAEVLGQMKQQGCERILVLPLYPQYASSSTASAFDEVFAQLGKMRNTPAIRTVKHYHDHPGYIAALAQNVQDYWMKAGKPDKLVISFHGVPRFTLDKGDPYHCECQKTGRLLAEALELQADEYQICFQSRFGRTEWLTPYTAKTLEQLGKQNIRRVDVVCPGFVSDCLETLEEIAMEGKAIFIQAGGQEFHYIPCLNERDDWIQALADIALANLQGWLGLEHSEEQLTQSQRRALEMGAAK
ncbi:ferrochelatase [Nitrosospira sp. NpAV]|uniref:ferrochelatase n=1 Tax=Nitrosospira sp. NpAV TaxID=58133 RepID=UPI00059F07CA|nr:ferrochelatase [Nitrosospira sp. NpAV]KIO49460.1 ferrochelatase [Nitrosospira sp. NpAV]